MCVDAFISALKITNVIIGKEKEGDLFKVLYYFATYILTSFYFMQVK